MYRTQWPQTQLADPHAVAQAVAVLVPDDIPIAEFVHHGWIGWQMGLGAILSADDIMMAELITALTRSLHPQRCELYDSISSGSSCLTPSCFSSNTSHGRSRL